MQETGVVKDWSFAASLLLVIDSLTPLGIPACFPGLRHEDLSTKFWRRRRVAFSPGDVILRIGFDTNNQPREVKRTQK